MIGRRLYHRFQPIGLSLEFTSEGSESSLPRGFIFAYARPQDAVGGWGPLSGGWAGFDPEDYEVVSFYGRDAYDPGDAEGVAVRPTEEVRRLSVDAWAKRYRLQKKRGCR